MLAKLCAEHFLFNSNNRSEIQAKWKQKESGLASRMCSQQSHFEPRPASLLLRGHGAVRKFTSFLQISREFRLRKTGGESCNVLGTCRAPCSPLTLATSPTIQCSINLLAIPSQWLTSSRSGPYGKKHCHPAYFWWITYFCSENFCLSSAVVRKEAHQGNSGACALSRIARKCACLWDEETLSARGSSLG